MLIQIGAGLLLAAVLWLLFRLAMGLRWEKVTREQARSGMEAQGRRVVAEIPLAGGELTFFQEDAEAFHWGGQSVRKHDIRGARLLLNGGVIGSVSRSGAPLPDPPAPADAEGRERWEVLLYLESATTALVPCGGLREGVSREIAGRVFEAVCQAAARPGRAERGVER